MTLAEQSDRFLADLAARKRRPVKPATLKAYSGYLRNWIVPYLGTLQLAEVENGVMRKFVNILVKNKLSPSTICGAVTTLKMLVGSDENGKNPREWNSVFIDAPAIDPDAQDAPIISGRALNAALSKAMREPYYQAYYALAAASGLRMGEMLALRMGPDKGKSSFLDLEKGVVFVRGAVYDRKEQSTRFREVDLCASLVTWLEAAFEGKAQRDLLFACRGGSFWHLATLYDHFRADGIPGSHSFRRFRTMHLENMSVPRVLVDYWTGRTSKTITVGARKNWCQQAGLGFQLPKHHITDISALPTRSASYYDSS